MSFIVATIIVASPPPKSRPTGTPTSPANSLLFQIKYRIDLTHIIENMIQHHLSTNSCLCLKAGGSIRRLVDFVLNRPFPQLSLVVGIYTFGPSNVAATPTYNQVSSPTDLKPEAWSIFVQR